MMESIIAYSYLAMLLFVSVVGVSRYRIAEHTYVRSTIQLLWFTTVLELTSKFIVAPLMQNTLWLFNLAIPVLFLLISKVFYEYFWTHQRLQRAIGISYLLFLPFYMINLVYIQNFYMELHSYAIQVMAILIMTWSFFYFRFKLRSPESGYLERDPMFWISAGFLVYYGVQIFAVGSINYYLGIGEREIGSMVTSIIQLINIPMNLLFLTAIICPKYPKTSSSL